MGLEAFKRQDSQRTDEEESKPVTANTLQTDLKGRLLADGSGGPNPQVSLKEYLR